MNKHTPKPWTRGEGAWSSHVIAPSKFGPHPLAVFSGRGRDEDDANAQLTAAAPEMLEALRAVLAHVEDEDAPRVGGQCTLCKTYRDMIRAAIAKAERTPESPAEEEKCGGCEKTSHVAKK